MGTTLPSLGISDVFRNSLTGRRLTGLTKRERMMQVQWWQVDFSHSEQPRARASGAGMGHPWQARGWRHLRKPLQ